MKGQPVLIVMGSAAARLAHSFGFEASKDLREARATVERMGMALQNALSAHNAEIAGGGLVYTDDDEIREVLSAFNGESP